MASPDPGPEQPSIDGLIAEEFCRAPCSVSRPACPLTPRRFWGDYLEQFDVRNFQQMARGNKLESARLYADRVAGCCCHHCHFGLVAASCFGESKAENQGGKMLEQRKTNRARISLIRL